MPFLLLLILIAIIFGGWGVFFTFLVSFAIIAFFWKVAIFVVLIPTTLIIVFAVVSVIIGYQRDEARYRAIREADIARLAARAARLAAAEDRSAP